MINLRNVREVSLSPVNVSATVPPHAPTADAVIARGVSPCNGKVKALVVAIAAAGTAGDSTTHKQEVWVRNATYGGAGTTQMTGKAILKNAITGSVSLPAAGTKVVALGSSGNRVSVGEILEVYYDDTGTLGTGTRATFNIVSIIIEADKNADAT